MTASGLCFPVAAQTGPLNWNHAKGVCVSKPYHEMTPAERLAARIAKNREIDQRVQNAPVPEKKRRAAAASSGTKSGNNALERFHEIRRMHGIDAAAEYLRERRDK